MELCNSRSHSLIIATVNSRLRALLPVADPGKRPGSRPPPSAPPPPLCEGLDPPLITRIVAHRSLTNHVPKYMRRLTKHERTIIAAVDLGFLWVLKLGSEGQFFSVSVKRLFVGRGVVGGRGGGVKRTPTWDCTPRYGTGDNSVCSTQDRDLAIWLVDYTLSFVCIFSTFLKNPCLLLQKWKSRCN